MLTTNRTTSISALLGLLFLSLALWGLTQIVDSVQLTVDSVSPSQSPLTINCTLSTINCNACQTAKDANVTFDLLDYFDNGDETTTLHYRVTKSGQKNLLYVAMGVPDGWAAVSPADGSNYSGALGDYTVNWTDDSDSPGFASVKFTPAQANFNQGQSEVFTVVVSGFDGADGVELVAQDSLHERTASFGLAGCEESGDGVGAPTTTMTPPDSPLATSTLFVTMTATDTATVVPTATPFPDLGLRMEYGTKIILQPDEQGRTYTIIKPISIEDNALIAFSDLDDQSSTVLSIDLQTGIPTRISNVIIPVSLIVQSNKLQYDVGVVAWLEKDPKSDSPLSQFLHTLDIMTGEKFVSEPIFTDITFSLRDNVVVSSARVNRKNGIYGYDLETQEIFTVAHNVSYRPIACNTAWVIYQDFHSVRTGGSFADISAYNRFTHETTLLGHVWKSDRLEYAKMYDCEGDRVVWLGYSPQIDSNETRPAILLYEFSSKRLRVLDESPPNLPFAWNPRNDVMSEDMAMLGFGIGYDLQSGIRFNTDIPLFRKEVDDGTHGIDSFVEQYVIDRSRIFVPYRRMPDSPVPFYIASVED